MDVSKGNEMKVYIPYDNQKEREYIIDVVLNEFLGIAYTLAFHNQKSWILELENGKKLIINDHFFYKFPKEKSYLDEGNIPKKVLYIQNKFIATINLPLLYGSNKVQLQNNNLICDIDIFAAIFFMLTRWEEYVIKKRDHHNRFISKISLAYRNNFYNRPIVNEYLEFLKNMLLALGYSKPFKQRSYKLILTHDIDHIKAWSNPKRFFMRLGGDILKKRAKGFDIVKILFDYLKVLLKIKKDPFDTFDYIMNLSESIGVKSYFFFMGGGVTKYDNSYKAKQAKKIAQNILQKGHFIGIHPSYNAYNDVKQFQKEKETLEKTFETPILFGREHYLRFEVPTTWQVWEDNKMAWDSSCGFENGNGFRCGVCYPFSVFNILTREKLNLKERPLIFMDASVVDKYTPNQMEDEIFSLICQVEKYQGEFVLLWHNSSYNTIKWKKFKKVYEKAINYHKKRLQK